MRWWVYQIYKNSFRDHNFYAYQSHYIEPGRWRRKKNIEEWMRDYHPEPGYPNISKNEKLKELKLKKEDDNGR